MNQSVPPGERISTFFPVSFRLDTDETVTLRLLEPTDDQLLTTYLSGLSEQTKSYFQPHSFDAATVSAICQNLDHLSTLRTVIVGNDSRIIAYMLILFGVLPNDLERLTQADVRVNSETSCSLAPSVADDYQSKKVGSHVLPLLVNLCRDLNYEQIVLWGGVQKRNQRAVNYYTKFGFMPVNEFWHNDLDNYDMILTLR